MIKKSNTDINFGGGIYDLYMRLYNLGEVFQREIKVNSEEFSDGSIDIYDVLQNNNLLSDNNNLNISFEFRDYVQYNFIVSDINRSRDELAFDMSELSDSDYTDIVDKLSNYTDIPLYIQSGDERTEIINVVSHENKTIVLVLNERNSSLFRSEEVNLYYLLYNTNVDNFLLTEQEVIEPRIVLTNHRKKNLSNYDNSGRTEQNDEKLYGDLNSKIDEFTTEDYINLKEELNYNFDEFENHVRFGSAYSKITNAVNKIDDIKEYQEKLDNSSGLSSDSESIIVGNIREIVDGFTLYEDYIYGVYKDKTENEFDNWISQRKEDAELYDLQNDEFILYLFPPDIIEDDDTGYFTNFVLLMGEFFDNIWIYIEALSNIKERNFYSEYQISSKFIDDVLREMGINKEVKFTKSGLNDYFTGTDNLKKVSEIISRRLLYNLPFLYKTKGTVAVIKQLINVFGIPDGILDVYEFGATKNDLHGTHLHNDYDWYLEKSSSESISVDVSNSNINTNGHTFEFVINNINSDGELLYINADNYIEIESNNDTARLNIYNDGSLVKQTDYFIRKNDQWTYIGITNEGNNSGSIYSWQQEKSGYGIVNKFIDDISWSSNTYGTHSNVELIRNSDSAITEFRLFNTSLLEKEAEEHAHDFRSIAEEEFPETLECRVKFYKPDGSTYDELNSIEGLYTVDLTGIEEENFKIDEFFNYTHVKYIPSEDGRDKNVRIEDRVNEAESLTRFMRTTEFEYERYSNDSNILGVFVSPVDKFNTAVLRRIGDFVDLVPSDLDDNKYRFETLEENKKYLSDIPDNYSNMYIYNSLLKILNQRIFKLLEDFVPASSQLEYGLLIKNHILNKIKGRSQTKSAKAHLNYELVIDNSKQFNNNERQNIYKTINPIAGEKSAISQFDKVNLVDKHMLKLKSKESEVHLSIKNPSQLKTDFYTKRLIKGFGALPPDPDEIEVLANAGASILIT